jgi:alpha-L-rhamnosidase
MLPDGSINPGELTSFNHYALVSWQDWMHTVIGGLKALEPGWKRFMVKPIPGGKLTYARSEFHRRYGVIKTE